LLSIDNSFDPGHWEISGCDEEKANRNSRKKVNKARGSLMMSFFMT